MLKKMKSEQGMALATIVGILAVITVLTASLFVFSKEDVFQASTTLSQTRAEYLARAGVEAAAKGFPKVAGIFDTSGTQSVLAELYLHYDGEEPILNTVEAGSVGKAEVKVSMGKRSITVDKVVTEMDVWCYDATAKVDNYTATSKGFVPPVIYSSQKPTGTDNSDGIYMGWVNSEGLFDKSKFDADPAHAVNTGSLGGFFQRMFQTIFGSSVKLTPYLPKEQAFGALVINQPPTGAKPLQTPRFTKDNREFYLIAAQSIFVEPRITLNYESQLNLLSLDAESIVFENEIHLYAPALFSLRKTVGNLILSNEAKMNRYIYFKAPVYVHRGSTIVKLFEGGTAYKLNKTVDLLGYAYDTNQVFRGLFGNSGNADQTYTGDELEKVDLPAPTVNSMTKIVWE